jgi:hypothetical protein
MPKAKFADRGKKKPKSIKAKVKLNSKRQLSRFGTCSYGTADTTCTEPNCNMSANLALNRQCFRLNMVSRVQTS